MKTAATVLLLSLAAATESLAQSDAHPPEIRISGTSVESLCKQLLDARRRTESEGRLDFAVEVESATIDDSAALVARVSTGSTHAVGRIDFVGHSKINDSTLRKALVINERELLDVGDLRRSLARINSFGVFEPLTLADVGVAIAEDGVTVDLTIPLRERKSRSWSLSAPLFPVVRLQASLASRLPPWGRGAFEAATYVLSLNVAGFARPFLALQRPIVPGQEWLSGFAISPALSPRAMLVGYGRTHLAHSLGAMLDGGVENPLVVPVASHRLLGDEPLVCTPDKGHLWWLRRIAATAVRIALP
jgi:hypothetical protein